MDGLAPFSNFKYATGLHHLRESLPLSGYLLHSCETNVSYDNFAARTWELVMINAICWLVAASNLRIGTVLLSVHWDQERFYAPLSNLNHTNKITYLNSQADFF